MDWKSRLKNPWFWVGIVSIILTALGADPSSFTSWGAIWSTIVATASNPYMLATVALAVLAVFVDPSTPGLKDVKK